MLVQGNIKNSFYRSITIQIVIVLIMTFCLAEFYFYSYKLAPYSKLNDAVPAIEQLQVHLPVCRTGETAKVVCA